MERGSCISSTSSQLFISIDASFFTTFTTNIFTSLTKPSSTSYINVLSTHHLIATTFSSYHYLLIAHQPFYPPTILSTNHSIHQPFYPPTILSTNHSIPTSLYPSTTPHTNHSTQTLLFDFQNVPLRDNDEMKIQVKDHELVGHNK